MIEVSREYKEAMNLKNERAASARVVFEILDNEAYRKNKISTSKESEISKSNQLTNKIRDMETKYATFEKNYLKLDGSFHIPPKNTDLNCKNVELGYWSDEISNKDGYFALNPVIELVFSEPCNSMGLTLNFDSRANVYPVFFNIKIFNNKNEIIVNEDIKDNNSTVFMLEKGLDNYTKIVLTFKKMNKAFRRLRLTEIDFGIIKEYKKKDIISLNLIEELDITSNELSSNEVKVTIENLAKDFNILNPQGFYRFLREKQEMKVFLGIKSIDASKDIETIKKEVIDGFEEVPAGTFYLNTWKSEEGGIKTTFTARDIFEIIKEYDYENEINSNMYDLAEDIIKVCNVEKYNIDENLKLIKTEGFKKKINARKALQHLGIATKSAIYQDRYGVLQVKQFEVLDEEDTLNIHYIGDSNLFLGVNTYSTIDTGYDMKQITLDNAYNEPQIELDDLIKNIEVVIYDYTKESKETYLLTDETVKEGKTLKVDNPLITDMDTAKTIASWLLQEYRLRAIFKVNWRQNPCLEPGDLVNIENRYGDSLSRIIKNEFEFKGYLTGKTTTKGGV